MKKHNVSCCNSGGSVQDNPVWYEFVCHFPYAVMSVALGLIVLSMMTPSTPMNIAIVKESFHRLFHSFHYLHILFATSGAIFTFLKYSRNWIKGIFVASFVSSSFCIISDILVPYVGGRILGVKMNLHICFFSEFTNICLFILIGILTGLVLKFNFDKKHNDLLTTRWLHFGHILLSSMASMFYMVSHGFINWDNQMGLVYIVLIIAVVVPCTFSDIIIPTILGKSDKK